MNRREIFIESLNKLIQRNGENLPNADIEPLVMNLAYLDVLKARKSGTLVHDYEVLKEYAHTANELIPQLRFNPEALLFGYQATLQWDGLWEFLQNYFISKLAWNIDENDLTVERFDSSSHTREEFGQFVSKSDVNRKVELMFKDDKRTLNVRISESLSDKKAILVSSKENRKVYIGTDPDYKFTIVYDAFGTIEEFILELLPRNLRITYHE